MLLSIIVPAYKVEGYIERCIRSLEDQDLSKEQYEIIITNDGSPDRCKEIVESLQDEFPNIILINQENQGVSMARNNAMAIAKGKYILPIDPDDYVVPNSFIKIINQAVTNGLDVLILNYEIFDINNKKTWESDFNKFTDKTYENLTPFFYSTGHSMRDPDRTVAMLFKRLFLEKNNIVYPRDIPALEDGLFLGKVFCLIDKYAFSNGRFYLRTTRPGSATNSTLFFSTKALDGFINAAVDMRNFFNENTYRITGDKITLAHLTINKFVLTAMALAIGSKKRAVINNVNKQLKINGFARLYSGKFRVPYNFFVKAYNTSVYLFIVSYYIFSRVDFCIRKLK